MAKMRKRRRPPVTSTDDRGALAAAWDPERDPMRNALEYLRSDCAAVGKVEAEGAGRVQMGRRRELDRSRWGSGARLRDGEHDADNAGDHGGADGVEGAAASRADPASTVSGTAFDEKELGVGRGVLALP